MNYYTLSVLFSLLFQQSAFGNNDLGICDSARKAQVDTTVFTVVEVPPEFLGGIIALRGFIKSHSKIPVTSKPEKRTIMVYLKLLVERDGRISAVQTTLVGGKDGRSYEKYEREARRIALDMPRWRPGSQDGKRLRVYALVPILFRTGF